MGPRTLRRSSRACLWCLAYFGIACAVGDERDGPSGTSLPMDRTTSEAGTDAGTGDASTGGETTPAQESSDDTNGDADSTGDTGETSGCFIEGAGVWRRHAFRLTTQTWDAPQPLDELWVGSGAPPPRGIVAAAATAHSGRLFIITEAGCLHERVGAQWLEMPLAERFAEAAGSYTKVATAAEWPDFDELTLIDNPTARVYELSARGNIVGEPLVVTMQDEPIGAPQGTGTAQWAFIVTDPSLIDVSAWFDAYSFYDDGTLYWWNAGTAAAPGNGWSSYPSPGGNNPIFQGVSPHEPDPNEVRAAYYGASADRVYFIAP
jgi:hypothetical protein